MSELAKWLPIRWDSCKDEPYFRMSPSEPEREGTQYWLITKNNCDIEGLEKHKDLLKVWPCDSFEEARHLSKVLCEIDDAREKAANKWNWVPWLCIGLLLLLLLFR